MDGLRPHEEIGFVLTTNAIDRMESAVKDRPGRISQCIHMGAPDEGLRSRYLARYLRDQDASAISLERLVTLSKGATQAFLKEWVHRAVQIAVERLAAPSEPLQLANADFEAALEEMRRYGEEAGGRILGLYL